jgi:hypothetical protein
MADGLLRLICQDIVLPFTVSSCVNDLDRAPRRTSLFRSGKYECGPAWDGEEIYR